MRKLLLFTCGFASGCLLCAYLLRGTGYWWALAAGGLLLALTLIPKLPLRRQMWLAACGLIFSLLWCWFYGTVFLKPARQAAGVQTAGVAEVTSYPVRTDYGGQVEAYVQTKNGMTKALLYLSGEELDLKPGDLLHGSFSLRPSNRLTDGSEFLYYQSVGIFLVGSCRIESVSPAKRLPLRAVPLWLSQQLKRGIDRAAPKDAAPFLKAILTGDRSELPYGTTHDLRAAGLSHIIAVSGMHVSLLLGALYLAFGRGGKRAAILGIPLLILFALMTGMSASVLRASLMLIILLLAPVFGREKDMPTALAAAAFLILLQNPWSIANVGFQLSFLAMLGLMLITQPLYDRLSRSKPWCWLIHCRELPLRNVMLQSTVTQIVKKLAQGILAVICASVGALIFTLPITAWIYGTVSVYSLLSNILCLWAMAFCFAGGLLTAIAGLFWPVLGTVLGWLTAWPVRYIRSVAHWIAELPMSVIPASSLYTVAFLVFAYLVLLLVLILREQRFGKPMLCVLAALAVTMLCVRLDYRVDRFTVTALDVGQGQCICVRTPSFSAVIDCGGSDGDDTGAEAAAYLKNAGVTRLDALIITHYDMDHMNGAYELMRELPVAAIYLPDVPFAPETRAAMETAAEERGVLIRYVAADLTLEFQSGRLTVFAPVSDETSNAASLSVLFTAGDWDLLVTGDMDAASERLLLETHTLPDLELLVAGHHGASASTGMRFLETTKPEAVIISVGRNNYGHPAQAVLERIARIGAVVYRTDICGDIEIRR